MPDALASRYDVMDIANPKHMGNNPSESDPPTREMRGKMRNDPKLIYTVAG